MLTSMRNTPQRLDPNFNNIVTEKMAAATTLFVGSLVCLNAAGYLVRGSTSATLKAVGVLGNQPFEIPGPSITNAGANGDKTAEVRVGVFLFDNDPNDPVGQDDWQNDCYITDDETVCGTSAGSTKSKAGRVIEVTEQGVWVAVGVPGVNVTGSQGAQGAQGPQGPQGAPG